MKTADTTSTTPTATTQPAEDSNTITLDSPLKRGEQTITTLTVLPPHDSGVLRGVRLALLMQLDVDSLAVLLPRVTSPTLTTQDVYRLAPADLMELASKVLDFLLPKSAKAQAAATPT